jgi:hypothetical protein
MWTMVEFFRFSGDLDAHKVHCSRRNHVTITDDVSVSAPNHLFCFGSDRENPRCSFRLAVEDLQSAVPHTAMR